MNFSKTGHESAVFDEVACLLSFNVISFFSRRLNMTMTPEANDGDDDDDDEMMILCPVRH